jgi:hypothetical protein
MRFPFVFRARFEDKERQILELKQELAEVRLAHARVVDEINFRSTGFHLDPRFATQKPEGATSEPAAPPEELTGIAKVINEVGTRPSAVRRYMEQTQVSEMEKAEAAARAARDMTLRAEAARRLEEALQAGTPKASA